MSKVDTEGDPVAPHVKQQIVRDLRRMTKAVEHHLRQIEERHEYVRLEGAEVRAAIAGLRGALDKLAEKF